MANEYIWYVFYTLRFYIIYAHCTSIGDRSVGVALHAIQSIVASQLSWISPLRWNHEMKQLEIIISTHSQLLNYDDNIPLRAPLILVYAMFSFVLFPIDACAPFMYNISPTNCRLMLPTESVEWTKMFAVVDGARNVLSHSKLQLFNKTSKERSVKRISNEYAPKLQRIMFQLCVVATFVSQQNIA